MSFFDRAIRLIFNAESRSVWFSVLLALNSSSLIFSADYNESRYFLAKKGKGQAEIPVIVLSNVSSGSKVQVVRATDFLDGLKFRRSIDIHTVPASALRKPEGYQGYGDFDDLVEFQRKSRGSFENSHFQTSPFQRVFIDPKHQRTYPNSHLSLYLYLLEKKGALAKNQVPLGIRISDFNRNCLNTFSKVDFVNDLVRPIVGLGSIGLLVHFMFSSSNQGRVSRLVKELGCDWSVASALVERLRSCPRTRQILSIAMDRIPEFRKNGYSQQEIMEHVEVVIGNCIDEVKPNEKKAPLRRDY